MFIYLQVNIGKLLNNDIENLWEKKVFHIKGRYLTEELEIMACLEVNKACRHYYKW